MRYLRRTFRKELESGLEYHVVFHKPPRGHAAITHNKGQKKHFRWRLGYTIGLSLLGYLLFITLFGEPHRLSVCWNIYQSNTCVQESTGISMEKVLTDEPTARRYSRGRSVYEIILENGTKVAIYAQVLEDTQIAAALEQHLGETCTYTYIPVDGFRTDAYVLLSVSAGEEVLLDKQLVVDWYYNWLFSIVRLCCIFGVITLICIFLPILCRFLWKIWKQNRKEKRKRERKVKNEEVRKRRMPKG